MSFWIIPEVILDVIEYYKDGRTECVWRGCKNTAPDEIHLLHVRVCVGWGGGGRVRVRGSSGLGRVHGSPLCFVPAE